MEEYEVEEDVTVTDDTDENASEPVTVNGNELDTSKEHANKHKLVRLPLSRIKTIMKKEPNVLLSQDAVFLATKATEMFIEFVTKEAAKHLEQRQRKTVTRRDVDNAIECCPSLCFLDGALD